MAWNAASRLLLQRPSVAAVALLAGAVFLGISGRAESDVTHHEAEEVRRLGARIHILERRIATLEQVGIRDERAEQMTPSSDTSTSHDDACAFPYEMSAPGVLHLKDECVKWTPGSSCMTPYTVDARGVLEINPNCLNGRELTNCDPPFVYDDRGVKAYLPGCYPRSTRN